MEAEWEALPREWVRGVGQLVDEWGRLGSENEVPTWPLVAFGDLGCVGSHLGLLGPLACRGMGGGGCLCHRRLATRPRE
jgi:hypothetical protein